MRKAWAVMAAAMGSVAGAHAIAFLNLPGEGNTGISGGAWIAAGQLDPDWINVSRPATEPNVPRVVGAASGWLATSATSRWIGPGRSNGVAVVAAAGTYVYRIDIDLGGMSTVGYLEGRLLSDNTANVYLNGDRTTSWATSTSAQTWTNFKIDKGWILGQMNFLEVVVQNSTDSVTGFRVEFTKAEPVPEPATLAGLAAGLALLARRRRR
ncbi:MAG: PEP-CTERM sorting domain-containing protein [Fimbriimonadales bacterium]|nr:PEP-CTERM sorting domain-containing protein [Fimbriimonadales bacterium]